ncbi:unnamed protein product [Gongylonema pulchrum]|uniref:START domain-containing protein n=1 Tax=Gongylonema pulchrum TaxID=637853 RepID=A0A183EEA6_9BILA|nr:unnamed protein product [Gongylonema pulchrum]
MLSATATFVKAGISENRSDLLAAPEDCAYVEAVATLKGKDWRRWATESWPGGERRIRALVIEENDGQKRHQRMQLGVASSGV